MKKLLPAIIMLLISSSTIAQISIVSSDMPKSGSKSTVTTAIPTSINLMLDQTGANYTWDYSNLAKLTDDVVTYDKATDISSIYIFFGINAFGRKVFDEMTFGAVTIKDVYDFYKNSSSKFQAVGRGISFNGTPIPSFFTDNDNIYEFPVQFGNNLSDNFKVIFTLPGLITLTQSGTRTTNVDGWGQVTTPYKTYDCLRVYSKVEQTNKVESDLIPIPIQVPTNLIEYRWIAKGEVIPVLTIRGTEVAGNFVPNYVAYRSEDPIKQSTDDVYANKVNIYPNPAVNSLNINVDNGIINQVTIVNSVGKTVYTGTDVSVDISSFNKGIYFVTVDVDGKKYIRKVVKQ